MDKKQSKILRYIIGSIFVISFVDSFLSVIGLYDIGSIPFLTVLCLISTVLMAVSIFSGIYSLMAVGAGIQAISYLTEFARLLSVRSKSSINFLSYIMYLLPAIGCALIIIMVLTKRSALKISFLASVLLLVRLIVPIIIVLRYGGLIVINNAQKCLYFLCTYCLPIILTGFLLSNTKQIDSSNAIAVNAGAENPNSQIDNIFKLKELLDTKAITQEEFEAKKKQLLKL